MELPMSQEEEDDDMPIPLNSRYGGPNYDYHHHHHPISHNNINNTELVVPSSNGVPSTADNFPSNSKKIIVRYKECLKNHAASMGGTATDGCGEFMPTGEEGSLEALICSACSCHRNFHRKEIEGDNSNNNNNNHMNTPRIMGRNSRFMNTGHHHQRQGFVGPLHHPGVIMSDYNNYTGAPSADHSDRLQVGNKKRFRTKFTQEQKEKMLSFAERIGWRLQKQEEGAVQQFCQEIGVKRRVLKVWMHNNKHSLAKKINHDHDQSINDDQVDPQNPISLESAPSS